MTSGRPVQVFVEAGRKRVFASALDWPGWSRSGKTEEAAIAALADYLPRYGIVVRRAGLDPPAADFAVCERAPGSATVDFGSIDTPATSERQPIAPDQGLRFRALLEAGWAELAAAAARAPAVLPKGPRGGGRDRDAIVAHVADAEVMYLRKLGIRLPRPGPADEAGAAAEAATRWLRAALTAALAAGMAGPPVGQRGWPPRYAIRRIGWHALDHAWELQDKSVVPEARKEGTA